VIQGCLYYIYVKDGSCTQDLGIYLYSEGSHLSWVGTMHCFLVDGKTKKFSNFDYVFKKIGGSDE